ncbi:MAG: MarR family transcriptional regulator [Pseudomonadota bacterium]
MSRKSQPSPADAFVHNRAIGFLLAQAHNRVRARMVAALGEGPLHLGHVVLLSSLYAQNDLTQVQLTQMSGIEKSSVVLFLDALEKDGWVERRAHATDRRAHAVHLTRKGRARFEEIGVRLAAAETDAMSPLSATERKQLEALLLRLIAHLC